MNVSEKAAARGGEFWARLCALPVFNFRVDGAFIDGAHANNANGDWIDLAEVQQIVDDAESRIAELKAQAAVKVAPELPAMNPDLERILGIMCFECIHFAQAFRMAGQPIARKAEAEQAATIHWLLGHYFRSGANWRVAATADMERMKYFATAAQSVSEIKP